MRPPLILIKMHRSTNTPRHRRSNILVPRAQLARQVLSRTYAVNLWPCLVTSKSPVSLHTFLVPFVSSPGSVLVSLLPRPRAVCMWWWELMMTGSDMVTRSQDAHTAIFYLALLGIQFQWRAISLSEQNIGNSFAITRQKIPLNKSICSHFSSINFVHLEFGYFVNHVISRCHMLKGKGD